MTKLRVVDLFAGCGGLSLGFQNAGFEIEAAFDNWEAASRVYRLNFAHPAYTVDLSDPNIIARLKLLRPGVIVGGPPCQDFSSAGKRDEELGRGDLTVTFARIVREVRPRFFVMENVPRIQTSRRLTRALAIFEACGYGLSTRVLDASLCGVPQARTRYFLIGELGGQHSALEPYLDSGLAPAPMTVREYFGTSLGLEHYYRHPRNYSRRAIYSVDEPSPTIRGVNRPVPRGYKGHPLDAVKLNPTIRQLTTTERSYIQTFPPSFRFVGSTSDLEQMIGNAVPVKLAEYVASCLAYYISDRSPCVANPHREHKLSFSLFEGSQQTLMTPCHYGQPDEQAKIENHESSALSRQ